MKELIDTAVDRFLSWALPLDFGPDCGISFEPPKSPMHAFPTGTNLFNATQAREMVVHVAAPLIAALEAAEAREATLAQECKELRARVAEMEGMVPKPHQIRLLLNALDFYKTSAVHDPDDPYLNLDFLESIDFATEWLSALPAAPKEEGHD